jgi:hypothetical protein
MSLEKPKRPRRKGWKHVRETLRYRIDQVFAGGSFPQLVLLAIVTALAILFGMSAYFFGLFKKENAAVSGIGRLIDEGFWDTLWWSAKHVFDPSFFDSNYGASWPILVISLIMSVIGMSLFATLLGFISNAIETRMEALKKGNSAVKEDGHLLILGWNDKIYSILNLLEEKADDIVVVILSHHDIEHMSDLLRVRGRQFRHVRIILRCGSPNTLVELQRVAYDCAYSIIVLADESSPNTDEASDVRVIKTLMLLTTNPDWQNAAPKMVAEVLEKDYLHVAQIAADNQVSILCSSVIISKVIVQTSRQPGLSRVYSELFGFAGNEIYIRDFPGCGGRPFGEIAACFTNAIPIGVSHMRMDGARPVFVPFINPGKDYIVQSNEWIICIAEDDGIKFDASRRAAPATLPANVSMTRQPIEQILILGWNDQIYDILNEFDGYMTMPTTILIAGAHTEDHAQTLIRENLPAPLKYAVVKYQKLNYIKQSALEKLPVGEVDHLIVLADTSSHEPDPDSRTIMTLLLLRSLLARLPEGRRMRLVAENADSGANFGIHINPQRDVKIDFSDADKVIVIALDLYDPA